MSGAIQSYRDLVVWQKSMALAVEVYRIARLLPKDEQYRLTSQLLRAAASVPANIAEGHARGTRKDYAKFVSISRGSLAETETFLMLAAQVGLLMPGDVAAAEALCNEVSRMLLSLHSRLRDDPHQNPVPRT
ncbi:MAG: four helix bundle protein [Hyphomicrobiaceae bacterium]|nr:four helix bundle protein [Hyphomicrobiaceae bacterium]